MLLDDLLSQTRMVTVKYGDAELNIEYYRARLTDAEGQRLVADVQASSGILEKQIGLTCQLLARLIAWWDLYESEGVPLVVSAEALNKLPISAIADICTAIFNNESMPVDAR